MLKNKMLHPVDAWKSIMDDKAKTKEYKQVLG